VYLRHTLQDNFRFTSIMNYSLHPLEKLYSRNAHMVNVMLITHRRATLNK
jgi:hypothetical protein